MQLKPFENTASSIAEAVRSQKLTARSVVEFYADRTEKLRGSLNTHLFWDSRHVLEQASRVDSLVSSGHGESMRLAGVPVVIKDAICTKGIPTTCASKILEGWRPPYDATVISRLQAEGAILFGKANMDEFAMGSSNENSAFGPVRNPWDLERVPGGSSGGSASAVAADLAPLALGSDTGGSIRQPASLCGIVGLKQTYGVVSRFGLVAFGSSLDHIGPMARNVADAALLLDVISGHDPLDSTSLPVGPCRTFKAISSSDVSSFYRGKRIGVPKEFFGEGLDPVVRQSVENALREIEKLGAKLVPVSLPNVSHSIATYYIVATAEASANLARYDGVVFGYRAALQPGDSLRDMYDRTRSEGFGPEVKRRIMLGTFVLSSGYYDAYYGRANATRDLLRGDFAKAFQDADFLVAPTSPTTAFRIGEKSDDPLSMYLSDICTIAMNLADVPAVSVPCGYDRQGLPIGLQIMGPRLSEEQIMIGAHAYEQSTRWIDKAKPSCGQA